MEHRTASPAAVVNHTITAAFLLVLAIGYGALVAMVVAAAMSLVLSAPALMLFTVVVVGLVFTIRGIVRAVVGAWHSDSH